MMITRLFILSLGLISNLTHAAPTVVFDLDHTLIDTVPRIVEIIKEVGRELDLPTLRSVDRARIDRVRFGDRSALGLSDEDVARVFGTRGDQGTRFSEFKRRFYHDPSYLRFDGVIPGAPEFVRRVVDEIKDVQIVYLSGRFENFVEETERQLAKAGFPGYDPNRPVKTTLILKPHHQLGSTDAFKVAVFAGLGQIVGVFDDSSRNVNAFAKILPPSTLIVRLTTDVNKRGNVDARVRQITNYVANQIEIEEMIELMKTCAANLE